VQNKAAREMSGDIQIVDNVFVKMIPLNGVGDKVQGHAHMFDHITLLSVGSVRMRTVSGAQVKEKDFVAPALLVTPKGLVHEFTSLADKSLICCIHAIREGDDMDDVASPDINKSKAYHLLSEYPLTQSVL
jgi:hypothetical protein